jgi:hypothetical protein
MPVDPRERRRKRLEDKKQRAEAKKKKIADKGTIRADKLAAKEDASGLWFPQMQLKLYQETISGLIHMQVDMAHRCETHAAQHVQAIPDVTMHELQTTDLKKFKTNQTPRWRKIRMVERIRRKHQGVIDSFAEVADNLLQPMRQIAAVYPQKYFRGRVARRLFQQMRQTKAMEESARKLQAVFRWKVTMERARRRIAAFKNTRILFMVLKIQKTWRLVKAVQQGYKEMRKLQSMTKAELQNYEIDMRKQQKPKTATELKISRQYKEQKVNEAVNKAKANRSGPIINRRDMEERIAILVRRRFFCKKLNRFIAQQIKNRRHRLYISGLATYLQGVVKSYIKKRKAMLAEFLNVAVVPVMGVFGSSSRDVKYMLYKLRKSEKVFPESDGREILRERVKDFCKMLSDCGVSLSVIREAFPPTPKEEFTKEWKKNEKLLKRRDYQRAHALHQDKTRHVMISSYTEPPHVAEVLLNICKNTRCETPWSCFNVTGSVCRCRRVFKSQLLQYKFLAKCCRHLRRACWRHDLMEEWLMVNDFLSQCANERVSCLENISDDKARSKMEEAEAKERHAQMALANKTMFGGLLSDDVIKEVVHVSCGRSLGSEVPSKQQKRQESRLWFRWFHKRLICRTCLATGTLENPVRGKSGSCQQCFADPHHTTAKGVQSTLAKAQLVKEAKDLREPLDQLIVHCVWRYLVPMEHHSRSVKSVTCYNVAAHSAKTWIDKLKRYGITTVGQLAQLRYTASPFGMQTVMEQTKLPVGLGDVISRVLHMIDKQQRMRNKDAIATNRVHGGLSELELAKVRATLQKNIKYEGILLSKGGANDTEIVLKRIKGKYLKQKCVEGAPEAAAVKLRSDSGTNLKSGSLAVERTKGSMSCHHSQRRLALDKAQVAKESSKMKAAEEQKIARAKSGRILDSMESGNLLVPFPQLKRMNWAPTKFRDILFNTKVDTLGQLLGEHPEIGRTGERLSAVQGSVSTVENLPQEAQDTRAIPQGDESSEVGEKLVPEKQLNSTSHAGHDIHILTVHDDVSTDVRIMRSDQCDIRTGTMNPIENASWGAGFSPMKSSTVMKSFASLSRDTAGGFSNRRPWSKQQHFCDDYPRQHIPKALIPPFTDDLSSDVGGVQAVRRKWLMTGEHGCSSPIQLRNATPSSARVKKKHNVYADKLLSQVVYHREMYEADDAAYRPSTAPAALNEVLLDGTEDMRRAGRCGKSLFG